MWIFLVLNRNRRYNALQLEARPTTMGAPARVDGSERFAAIATTRDASEVGGEIFYLDSP
jgi:hypothetical protein